MFWSVYDENRNEVEVWLWEISSVFSVSGMGKTNEKLLPSCKGAVLIEGKILKQNIGTGELMNWVNGLNV